MTKYSIVHLQWLKDVDAHKLLVGHAADGLDHLGGDDEADVAVGVLVAEAVLGLQVAHGGHDLRRRVLRGGPPHQVALPQRQAGAVGQEVADGGVAGGPGAVEGEVGQPLADGVLPAQPLAVDEDAEGDGGEELGVGGDAEQRAVVDGVAGGLAAQLQHAKALRDHGLPPVHERKGEAGDLEGEQEAGDEVEQVSQVDVMVMA